MLLTYSNVKSILPFVFAFLGHSFVIPRILVLNLGNELGLHLFERKGHIHLHFSSSHDPKPLVQNQKIYSIRGNTRSDANCFQILISQKLSLSRISYLLCQNHGLVGNFTGVKYGFQYFVISIGSSQCLFSSHSKIAAESSEETVIK